MRAPVLAVGVGALEFWGAWRSVNAPHLVALVRAGAKFEKGVLIERPEDQDQEAVAKSRGIRSTGLDDSSVANSLSQSAPVSTTAAAMQPRRRPW